VATHFGDSTGESTTSHMLSTKGGGDSSSNRSNLNKNNIIKPTFNTLIEEGHKAFEPYCTDLEKLFLSCCKVTGQGTVLKDTTPIIIHQVEVIPEVRHNPSFSLNDVQSMINSVLKRQVKSTDKLICRLIDERDRKKLVDHNVNPSSSSSCVVNFTQTNLQISGTSAGGATMPNPSTQLMNHFHS
jgi:hypothetical protein